MLSCGISSKRCNPTTTLLRKWGELPCRDLAARMGRSRRSFLGSVRTRNNKHSRCWRLRQTKKSAVADDASAPSFSHVLFEEILSSMRAASLTLTAYNCQFCCSCSWPFFVRWLSRLIILSDALLIAWNLFTVFQMIPMLSVSYSVYV